MTGGQAGPGGNGGVHGTGRFFRRRARLLFVRRSPALGERSTLFRSAPREKGRQAPSSPEGVQEFKVLPIPFVALPFLILLVQPPLFFELQLLVVEQLVVVQFVLQFVVQFVVFVLEFVVVQLVLVVEFLDLQLELVLAERA